MSVHIRRRMRAARQDGVAVITALLLTTLAVTIVASLFWQQQVQVRSMENQRLHLQTKWIMRGALDWARLVLRQDGFDHGQATTLDSVWATPLAETRLDQYIERERVEGENFDATLSGHIIDAQSRYNLANLADGRKVDQAQVEVYRRLLDNLRLDPSLAQRTADAMAKSQRPAALLAGAMPAPGTAPAAGTAAGTAAPAPVQAGSEPIELIGLDDLLSIPGYTADTVARLRDFAIVLPEPHPVNVNTASAEVLAAVVEFSVSEATTLTASRKQAYFKDMGDFTNRLNGKKIVGGLKPSVTSEYFLATSKVLLDRATLNADALIRRRLGGPVQTTLVWIRQN